MHYFMLIILLLPPTVDRPSINHVKTYRSMQACQEAKMEANGYKPANSLLGCVPVKDIGPMI